MHFRMHSTIRFYCTHVRKFSEIPCPPRWPILENAHLFFRTGPYSKDKLTEAVISLSEKYGPVFRLKFPGQEFVITTNPDDCYTLFHYYGKCPNRIPLAALAYYRKKVFDAIGVVPGSGEEWQKFRTSLVPLLKKSYIQGTYLKEEIDIAKSLVRYIRSHRNSNMILDDVFNHLMKYTLEAISIVSPGKRIHCLDEENPLAKKVIEANCIFMDGLYRTYSEPKIWKFYKTKGYRKMEKGHSIINELVYEKLQKLELAPEIPKNFEFMPFVDKLFYYSKLSKKEACLLATEVFLGGIDATATTLTMALYYLGKNKMCQELARKDAVAPVDHQPYLQACIRETLRLSPTAGGITMILPENVLLSDYFVPANTVITAFTSATSCSEKYYEDPMVFKPERWTRVLEGRRFVIPNEMHPYASLPFGHGPRMCPGRRLAEQEIMVALTEILTEFEIESEVDNVGMVYRMNRIPDKSVKLRFLDRKA